MGLRIWVEKLMLVLHIRRLGEETLARKVYEEQKNNNWPGLAKEAEKICEELSIENVHETKLSKKVYRSKVIRACHKVNEKRLKEQAEGKQKCEKIFEESYGKKEYIGNYLIKNVRDIYRTRFGMHPFAGNYSRDRRFARTDWLCRCRKAKEEESHLISGNCEVYGEIRSKYQNLNDDMNLVNFFNEVLAKRGEIEEKEKEAEKK